MLVCKKKERERENKKKKKEGKKAEEEKEDERLSACYPALVRWMSDRERREFR